MNKLITIITATYNSGFALKQCLESVLSQSYENIEYIIIDNCSTDQTLDIAKSYSEKISRLISEPDKGIFDALNKGIKIASGEIIAFLHADDFYASPTVIEEVMLKFESSGADSVYGDLQYVSKKNPEKVFRNWIAGEFSRKKILNGWMPPHPSFFVRRKCFKDYGLFNTDYQISADYDLILRLLYKHNISAAYIPKILVKMRTGGASNKSLRNILRKSSEDLKAIRQNNIGNFSVLLFKNLRKLNQFF